jgi:hypothetical protein
MKRRLERCNLHRGAHNFHVRFFFTPRYFGLTYEYTCTTQSWKMHCYNYFGLLSALLRLLLVRIIRFFQLLWLRHFGSGANLAPNSQACVPITLLLPIVGNWNRSRDSSVGIATGWAVRVQLLAGQDSSLLHSVQTGSKAYPASYSMGVGGFFPGGKAAGAWSWPLTSI